MEDTNPRTASVPGRITTSALQSPVPQPSSLRERRKPPPQASSQNFKLRVLRVVQRTYRDGGQGETGKRNLSVTGGFYKCCQAEFPFETHTAQPRARTAQCDRLGPLPFRVDSPSLTHSTCSSSYHHQSLRSGAVRWYLGRSTSLLCPHPILQRDRGNTGRAAPDITSADRWSQSTK